MQILEDNHIIDNSEMPNRIAVLKEKVEELLNRIPYQVETEVDTSANEKLEQEITMLKKELESKELEIVEIQNKSTSNSTKFSNEATKELKKEIFTLKRQLDKKEKNSFSEGDIAQENVLLKKQLEDKEKTIKELNFKLEMFKLAKSLKQGAGIDTKSKELKNIINEYIKEIDKSIESLNIE